MLHITSAPAPQTVKYIFFIKLNGHHHAIRHALGTHITVLDVAYVGHTVAYFKIYLIRTVKQRVINLFEAL